MDKDRDLLKAAKGMSFQEVVALEEMSTTRRETGIAKIEGAINYLNLCLENEEKVVVFVNHKEVARALADAFGDKAVSIVGSTPNKQRQANRDRFMADPTCRIIIGSKAMAEGWTLTAAHHVVFAEIFWVPGIMHQCADRCHRIGQRENVLVTYLVMDQTLDAHMVKTLVRKVRIQEAAIDGRKESNVRTA